ncbi:MAG: PaeR7I family type II restriction endonuclease [bacterium]|jgi:hypothetical protein
MAHNEPLFFSQAVHEFWRTRDRQANAQQERGAGDQGARAAVTGGRQMDGFISKLTELMLGIGVNPDNIYTRETVLPGYYRPTKDWDLIVAANGHLLAVIELKSQVGPSFGNNFNNRTEEAIGSACDIWTAYRERAFVDSPEPWLGYLFLLEDCQRSRSPVRVSEPHFKVFDVFRNASYAERYEIFCRRLVLERKYSAACFMMTDRNQACSPNNYTEPARDLSVSNFVEQLLRHVAPR